MSYDNWDCVVRLKLSEGEYLCRSGPETSGANMHYWEVWKAEEKLAGNLVPLECSTGIEAALNFARNYNQCEEELRTGMHKLNDQERLEQGAKALWDHAKSGWFRTRSLQTSEAQKSANVSNGIMVGIWSILTIILPTAEKVRMAIGESNPELLLFPEDYTYKGHRDELI